MKRLAREEDGFTLMEVLVVMAVISVLSVVTVSLITAIFDSHIRSGQLLDQQTTIETAYGFLAQRLSVAQRLGLEEDTTTLQAMSLSGDQMMFSPQNGTCVRVFFSETTNSIRAKISGECSNSDIAPVRGPNQEPVREGGARPGDADFDPAVDLPDGETCLMAFGSNDNCDAGWTGAATIASNVDKDRPEGVDETAWDAVLQAFKYKDEYSNTIAGPGPDTYACNVDGSFGACKTSKASSGSNNDWYAASDVNNKPWDDIASVDVTAYISPTSVNTPENITRVRSRPYVQNFSIRQVCPGTGTGASGLVPGTVTSSGRLDGEASATNHTVVSADTANVRLTSAVTPLMQTPTIGPDPAVWMNFNGQLTAKTASGSGSAEVRVVLLRDDVAGLDGQNRDVFVYPMDLSTTAKAIPFSGSFLVPRNPGDPVATTYRVQVRIKNTGGGDITYSTARDTMYFSYSSVAK